MNPGEANEYVINLGHVSQLWRKGHRIWLDVASSNFPWADRNMNTGNEIGEDATGVVATQTIFRDTGHAS